MVMTLGVTSLNDTVTLQIVTRGDDSYDANGNGVKGAESDPVDFAADVQPVSSRTLKDLPEGLRDQAEFSIWTRHTVNPDDVIIHEGNRHRILKTWARPDDGFTKAVMGELK